MAEKKYEFTSLDVQWMRKSIELQRSALLRSRGKEIVGSEIYELRSREIAALSALMEKLA